MPIYAYRCTTCGHAQDVLQKISDPLLSVCPACGASTYAKQVTAAGFQLKGSGWYVTDFRGDNKAKKGADSDADKSAAGDKPDSAEKKSDGDAAPAKADGNGTPGKAAESAAPASAPAAAPAPATAPAAPTPPSKSGS
jgi:putative FmdB family regulatory protein